MTQIKTARARLHANLLGFLSKQAAASRGENLNTPAQRAAGAKMSDQARYNSAMSYRDPKDDYNHYDPGVRDVLGRIPEYKGFKGESSRDAAQVNQPKRGPLSPSPGNSYPTANIKKQGAARQKLATYLKKHAASQTNLDLRRQLGSSAGKTIYSAGKMNDQLNRQKNLAEGKQLAQRSRDIASGNRNFGQRIGDWWAGRGK